MVQTYLWKDELLIGNICVCCCQFLSRNMTLILFKANIKCQNLGKKCFGKIQKILNTNTLVVHIFCWQFNKFVFVYLLSTIFPLIESFQLVILRICISNQCHYFTNYALFWYCCFTPHTTRQIYPDGWHMSMYSFSYSEVRILST